MNHVPHRDLVFYDGGCGLCHGAVEFLLARDPDGVHFGFAPIGGQTFELALDAEVRAALPDSLVIIDPDGRVYVKSQAVRRALSRLGGGWRVPGGLMALAPVAVSDAAYDAVARVRKKLFPKPAGLCPIVPKEFRSRFLP